VRLHKLIFCSALTAVVSAAALPAGATAAEVLSGSGSTLVAPLEAEWALAFETLDRVKVTYSPTGSEAADPGAEPWTTPAGAEHHADLLQRLR
jgi:ABC-type phosphate transport system substrate-binding protein